MLICLLIGSGDGINSSVRLKNSLILYTQNKKVGLIKSINFNSTGKKKKY